MYQRQIVLYTRSHSLRCWLAKRLLARAGYRFEVVDASEDPGVLAEISKVVHREATLPYVFVDHRPLGDLGTMRALVGSGHFEHLVRGDLQPLFLMHLSAQKRRSANFERRGFQEVRIKILGKLAWPRSNPDLHFEIHELVAEGDIVAGRLTMSGTHEGPLMGTPPTGRWMQQAHIHFVRFRDGLAVEQWGVGDDLGMMEQLGVLPEPEQAGEASPTQRLIHPSAQKMNTQKFACLGGDHYLTGVGFKR